MADRWAVATGNWSNTATWNGGTLPTAADDVFADGFTVTIDQNVTVLSIRTTQRSGGTAGGNFILNGGITLTADVRAGTTACLIYQAISASFVIGNVFGGASTNGRGVQLNSGAGTLTITGNILGGSTSNTEGVLFVTSSPLTIIGNVTGGTGGSSASGVGSVINYSSNLTITGNVTAGASGAATGVSVNPGSPTAVINGNLTASPNAAGFFSSGGTLTVNGNLFAAAGQLAASIPALRLNGIAYSASTGTIPFNATNILIHPTNTQQIEFRVNNAGAAGVARSLYTGGVNLNQPAINNVRSGTVYGASNEFTGTCAVPPAGSVALGVPVDNTTGTGLINQTVLQAALEAALAPNAANIVERSTNDNKAITFSWPVSGATITGQKSIDNGAYTAVVGAITFLRTESNRHYYALAYNAADRNTVESSIRYKMTDGTYTKYFNLHVVPSGDVDVVVTPLQAVVDQMIRGTRIEVPLGYTGTVGPVVVTDTSNNPIDISAPSELIISKKWRGDILVIPDGSITRSGAGNNQFTISASGATLIPGEHAWALRRLSDKFVFAKGDWVVKQTATKD